MSKPRRKRPTLKEKLAAALLTMMRETPDGRWEPCIPLAEAKGMTPHARRMPPHGAADNLHPQRSTLGGAAVGQARDPGPVNARRGNGDVESTLVTPV